MNLFDDNWLIFQQFLFAAGSHNIEHLKDPNVDANENIRIQINRMDIFNAKIVTL